QSLSDHSHLGQRHACSALSGFADRTTDGPGFFPAFTPAVVYCFPAASNPFSVSISDACNTIFLYFSAIGNACDTIFLYFSAIGDAFDTIFLYFSAIGDAFDTIFLYFSAIGDAFDTISLSFPRRTVTSLDAVPLPP